MMDGEVNPSWYNVGGFGADETGFFPVQEDPSHIENSTKYILNLINEEASFLGDDAKSRIMIGGVSGGAIITLNALLQSEETLAGCAAFSIYLPGGFLCI